MADLASVDDLATLMKLAPFTGIDLDQATLVIQIVSAWARGVSGQAWPDAPTGVPPDVRAVVLTASRRELNNPDKVITETMGPFNVTYSTPPDGFFTPAELAILRRFAGRPAGLFTISMSRGDVPTAFTDGYLSFGDGGEPLPYYAFGDPGWGCSDHFNQG
jgi:hypothetical protein